MKIEKPIVIELYELWNQIKARFSIVSPQPKSFTLSKTVQPITSFDSPKLDVIDLSDATSIAAAGTDTQTLQPPSGKIYIVRNFQYNALDPAGSGAGTHELVVFNGIAQTVQNRSARIAATFGNPIEVGFANGFVGDSSESPSTQTEQRFICTAGLRCNHNYPIEFLYKNNTDVAQAGTRTLKLLVEILNEGL